MKVAPTEPSRGVFASHTARRGNVAATKGAPTEPSRWVIVVGTVRILSPSPITKGNGPHSLPKDTRPPLLQVPSRKGAGKLKLTHTIWKLIGVVLLLVNHPHFIRLSWTKTSLMTTRKLALGFGGPVAWQDLCHDGTKRGCRCEGGSYKSSGGIGGWEAGANLYISTGGMHEDNK